MTKEKRLKRIEELQGIISGIVSRGRYYKNKKGIALNKESIKRMRQCEKAIENHKAKL